VVAGRILPENSGRLNQAALHWLSWAVKASDLEPHYLYVLGLASWGLDHGAKGDWPDRENAALRLQVEGLFGWAPKNVLAWLTSNPNGPVGYEQEQNLVSALEQASSSISAAGLVRSAIFSRQVSENPALQPAASELS
jgi:hypothetical protein